MEQADIKQVMGKLLRNIRESKKLTRQELADMAGCRYDEIRLYEKGKRIMRVDRLFLILEVLGIPVSENISKPEICQAAIHLSALDPDTRRTLLDDVLAAIRKTQEKSESNI